jgi:hypothetical protein
MSEILIALLNNYTPLVVRPLVAYISYWILPFCTQNSLRTPIHSQQTLSEDTLGMTGSQNTTSGRKPSRLLYHAYNTPLLFRSMLFFIPFSVVRGMPSAIVDTQILAVKKTFRHAWLSTSFSKHFESGL